MATRSRPLPDLVPTAMRAGRVDLPAPRAARPVSHGVASVPNASRPVAPVPVVAKRHEVLGLLVLCPALLLGLAVASYDVRGGRDWCGPFGARGAELLLAFLGTAAVLLPWTMFVQSIHLFRRTVQPFRPLRTLGTACIVVAIAAALYLALGERPLLGHLPAGGLVGATVGESLVAFVGRAGAHLVVLTALLVALVVRTRLSIVAVASSAGDAGIRTSNVARDGLVTVARAWRESGRGTGVAIASTPPAAIDPTHALTADAVASVIARSRTDHFDAEETGPVDAVVLDKLLADESHETDDPDEFVAPPITASPAPAAKRTRTPRVRAPSAVDTQVEAPVEHALEAVADELVVPVQAAPKRRAKRVEPVVEAPAEALDDGEFEPPPTAIEALPIVSHDDEIAAAMRAPAPVPETAVAARAPVAAIAVAPRDPSHPIVLPKTSLLAAAPRDGVAFDEAQLRIAAERLLKTLKDYTIDGKIVEIHPGPVVTTFEFVPAAGTKLSKIARLSDDIAMSLEANRVRIVAPIPGKGRVGFEIPNGKRQTVYLRELLETEAFGSLGGALPVAFGKDVVGAPFFSDLAQMPHLIVAGATGAGKSVGLNVMLTSLLYKRGPEEVRLLMIDPKMVELAVYDGIPHMLLPVVTDMKKAALALRWVVDEMERRYTLFAQTGARNITSYNERVAKALEDGTPMKGSGGPVRTKRTGTTVDLSVPREDGENAPLPEAPPLPSKLPYILVVVDEFADLMMVAGKDIESAVARLAQKARAAGIHVILATQRPSVDVITGVIKANFPARVAFKVSQKVDSRTILDQQGAEHLLGRGDMLILPPGSSDLRRVHCAFVGEDEVQAVTDHWRKQGTPTYDEDILRPREEESDGADEPEIRVPPEKYEKAVALVLSSRRCSVSWVQRQLAVGYNVAARIVEKMEREGIVSAPQGPGKDREVLG